MKQYIPLGFVAAIIIILDFATRKFFADKDTSTEIKKSAYRYYAKNYIMTEREAEFFKTLNDIFGSKWFVVPQVHLSALLNHKVKGQNWSAAFKHINGKSVDFVLVSKETNKTICAIELDDSTHDSAKRIERDVEIERIFVNAKIPLARFRNMDKLSRRDIVNEVSEAIRTVR